MRGHRRTKDGVASLAYDPRIHDDLPSGQILRLNSLVFIMDCRVKPGNDSGERSTPSTSLQFQQFLRIA
jgi:hypothetical protein